jgi:hypothetical protein
LPDVPWPEDRLSMDCAIWLPVIFFLGFMAMTLCALFMDAREKLGWSSDCWRNLGPALRWSAKSPSASVI